MADTERLYATLISNLSDGAAAHSTNRQMIRDIVKSVHLYPTLGSETGVVSERYEYGDVRRYGAVGDGVANDTTAWTNAFASSAGKTVTIPPAASYYKLAGSITVSSNTVVQGSGLAGEFRQTTAETISLNLGAATNVTLINVAGYGQGGFSNAWVDDNHLDIAVRSIAGNGLRVINCTFRNFALAGVYTTNTPNVLIQGNTFQGTHQLGATINIGSGHQYNIVVVGLVATENVRILNNDCSDAAFGIDTSGATTLLNSVIANNNVHHTRGQHGMYVGSGKLLVTGNTVTEFVNHGIKVYAGTPDTQRDITVIGNHVSSAVANGFGIVIALAATGVMSHVVVAGNQIRNRSATPTVDGLAGGILVEGAINALLSANNISSVYQIGISVANTQLITDLAIDGNLIHSTGMDGISIAAPVGSARLRIAGNRLSAIPAGYMGIKLSSVVDDVFVAANTVIGGFNSLYNGGSSTNLRAINNVFTGWASEPFPLSSVAVTYENNQDGKEFTTYSGTASLTDYDRYVGGNATTAGFTITVPAAAGRRGRRITFIKTDATANVLTINCAASNINGAANQTLTTQYAKMTIQSNNVTWFIVG